MQQISAYVSATAEVPNTFHISISASAIIILDIYKSVMDVVFGVRSCYHFLTVLCCVKCNYKNKKKSF